jgi:hypothetical protein
MSSNKLSTQGYFIKRLKDSGYVVYRIFDNYSESDPRKWTILIDPSVSSVFCTCYDKLYHLSYDPVFEFYDGGQFIPDKVKLTTDSFEVILEFLNSHNIINKHPSYIEKGVNDDK